MAFCSKCGAKIPDNARFCGVCGNPVAARSERTVEKEAEDHSDNIEEVEEIFASVEEGEMSLGTWEEEVPVEKPQPKRAPRHKKEVEKEHDKKPKKKESKGSFLKTLKTGVLAIGLPILLIFGGVWVYGLLNDNGGNGGGNGGETKELRVNKTSPEKDLKADKTSPKQEDVIPSGNKTKEEEKDAITDIRKDYEDRYTGTWQAEGRYLFNFSEVEELMNKDVAALIDRTMEPNDTFTFSFGNGKAGFISSNGVKSIYGDYFVRESGNITIDHDGETTALWMYSPNENTLYCYIYHTNFEGTPMAMAYKFKRISTKPKL